MIQKSLVKLYEESFKENWDLPALTDYTTGETVTYGGLAERIALTHEFFRELNVQPGAKVAVCGRDSSDWVVTYMAVITYGAVIVPILPDFNPVDITHIVNHSEAELLFVTDAIWEHIQPENLLNIKAAISLKRRSERASTSATTSTCSAASPCSAAASSAATRRASDPTTSSTRHGPTTA